MRQIESQYTYTVYIYIYMYTYAYVFKTYLMQLQRTLGGPATCFEERRGCSGIVVVDLEHNAQRITCKFHNVAAVIVHGGHKMRKEPVENHAESFCSIVLKAQRDERKDG